MCNHIHRKGKMPKDENSNGGPLKIPAPRLVKTRRALQRLYGHTTSDAWIPEGLWPELDELRPEHLRLRGQVADQLEALDALAKKHSAEDAAHSARLRQAHRDGTLGGVKDPRTPSEERAAEREAIQTVLEAGIEVLAEFADRVVRTIRDHEEQFLGDLRGKAAAAQDKRREAQRLAAEATAEEFRVWRLGQWVLATSEDHAFGRQPAPEPVPAPRGWRMPASGLERPWHRSKTPSQPVPA
jgi:hypothetical protein